MGNPDQSEVVVVVDGDQFDVFDGRPNGGPVRLGQPDRRSQRGLSLNHMGIGHGVSVGVDDHARAESAGRRHLHHRRAETLRLLQRTAFGQVLGGGEDAA